MLAKGPTTDFISHHATLLVLWYRAPTHVSKSVFLHLRGKLQRDFEQLRNLHCARLDADDVVGSLQQDWQAMFHSLSGKHEDWELRAGRSPRR